MLLFFYFGEPLPGIIEEKESEFQKSASLERSASEDLTISCIKNFLRIFYDLQFYSTTFSLLALKVGEKTTVTNFNSACCKC